MPIVEVGENTITIECLAIEIIEIVIEIEEEICVIVLQEIIQIGDAVVIGEVLEGNLVFRKLNLFFF